MKKAEQQEDKTFLLTLPLSVYNQLKKHADEKRLGIMPYIRLILIDLVEKEQAQ